MKNKIAIPIIATRFSIVVVFSTINSRAIAKINTSINELKVCFESILKNSRQMTMLKIYAKKILNASLFPLFSYSIYICSGIEVNEIMIAIITIIETNISNICVIVNISSRILFCKLPPKNNTLIKSIFYICLDNSTIPYNSNKINYCTY